MEKCLNAHVCGYQSRLPLMVVKLTPQNLLEIDSDWLGVLGLGEGVVPFMVNLNLLVEFLVGFVRWWVVPRRLQCDLGIYCITIVKTARLSWHQTIFLLNKYYKKMDRWIIFKLGVFIGKVEKYKNMHKVNLAQLRSFLDHHIRVNECSSPHLPVLIISCLVHCMVMINPTYQFGTCTWNCSLLLLSSLQRCKYFSVEPQPNVPLFQEEHHL